jgi:DNA-binding NtrC family response regulator
METHAQSRTTVLVVEDEPLVRMNAVGIFEEAGFITEDAEDAEDALRHLAANGDISLLFTDIDMPGGLNGLQLAMRVRELRPDMNVIITSGHRQPAAGDMPSDGLFLRKPYMSEELAAAALRMARWPRRPLYLG